MARIRTIKPEFWQDEKLGLLSPLDRLVFIGLISQADDAGRLVDSVRIVQRCRAVVFGEGKQQAVEHAAIGVIKRGVTASGQRVIQLVNWQKHQRVEKANLKSALSRTRNGPSPPRANAVARATAATPTTAAAHAVGDFQSARQVLGFSRVRENAETPP